MQTTEIKKLSESLAALIRKLGSNPSMNNLTMPELLAESRLTRGDIEPFSYYEHPQTESYGRLMIYQSERIKVFVLTWNTGDFTAIHDHEPAEWGSVLFFGDLTHRLYTIENDQVILRQADIFHSGNRVGVTGSLVHAMGNLSAVPALTLHIYGTNSQFGTGLNARVFDLEMGRAVMTDGAAFLSRNHADSIILPDRIWADGATLSDYKRNTSIWRAKHT